MNVPKLRFKEFNDEWKYEKLSSITNNISSGKISKKLVDGEYNVYGSMGIIGTSNFYDYDGEKVLVARVGANAGSVNKINEKCCISDNTLVLESNNILNDFLYFSLCYFNPKKLIFGSGQPLVTGSQLKNIIIGVPTILEQKKISLFMSLLDKKIELQSKKIEALKLYKKGLIDHLVSNMNIVNSKKLSQLGYTYSGLSGKSKEDFVDGNCKFITFMSVLKNNISENLFSTVKIGEKERQNKVLKGDLFFTGSSETKEEVGMVSTLNYDFDNLYLNSFCFGFRLNLLDEINNNFLCNLLLSSKYRKIISNLGQGFTRVNISKKELLDIDIEYPDYDDQLRITNTLNNMYSKIKLEEEKLSKLESLKKGLMQNMFV